MKTLLTKVQAREKVETFFQRASFTPNELKKILRLAMKVKIKLRPYRKKYCSSCFHPLDGKVRVTKSHKSVFCAVCNKQNRWSLKPKDAGANI